LNITEVKVMGITPPPGAEPSVKIPGNILRLSINENDGIRGIVQFNVTTVKFNFLHIRKMMYKFYYCNLFSSEAD
jgi:hypothetical protein